MSIKITSIGGKEVADEVMEEYEVTWSIDIQASSPEDAALQCRAIQQDPYSVATVFRVRRTRRPSDTWLLDVEDTDDVVELRG